MVDEAWGLAYPFHDELPDFAISRVADLALGSAHKTLSAFGQTSILSFLADRLPVLPYLSPRAERGLVLQVAALFGRRDQELSYRVVLLADDPADVLCQLRLGAARVSTSSDSGGSHVLRRASSLAR